MNSAAYWPRLKGQYTIMEITLENVRDIIVETLSCDAGDIKPETNLIEDLEKIHTVQDILDYIKSKQG